MRLFWSTTDLEEKQRIEKTVESLYFCDDFNFLFVFVFEMIEYDFFILLNVKRRESLSRKEAIQ